MKNIFSLLLFIAGASLHAQVPFPHIATAVAGPERVAKFAASDAPNTEFLEITNATIFDNQFAPTYWAHHQADNRTIMRFFVTTNTANDFDNAPLMVFRAEIRNSLNPNAPNGGFFPWGTVANDVTARPLFAWENGNTQLMRMLPNGFLGIGTIAPTARLHNNGTVRFENIPSATANTFVLTTDNDGNVSRQLASTLGGGIANSCTTSNFILKKGATDLTCSQIFDNGTGVGIGTITPSAKFHTNGTLRFENLTDAATPIRLLGTDNLGNVFEYDPAAFGGGSGPDYDWLKLDGSFPTSINDDIYTNGKVGINTNNIPSFAGDVDVSSYSLFAKGGILTEEVRVTLSSEWADYVFDQNYGLTPLEEVETFIKKQKHLKDIPSAAEVKRDGIELGEMNKLLLQKIEELTLYVIDLNKKMDAQNHEIDLLKQKK